MRRAVQATTMRTRAVYDDAGFAATLRTPFALLGVRTGANAVTGLAYLPDGHAEETPANAIAERAVREIERYIDDPAFEFTVPLAPDGTPFQRRVWAELLAVGFGKTATYGEIAHRLGMTNAASRAVGLANGRNPIPIVIPCHRVIGANGTLTGYAGGLERKQLLLDLETESLF